MFCGLCDYTLVEFHENSMRYHVKHIVMSCTLLAASISSSSRQGSVWLLSYVVYNLLVENGSRNIVKMMSCVRDKMGNMIKLYD